MFNIYYEIYNLKSSLEIILPKVRFLAARYLINFELKGTRFIFCAIFDTMEECVNFPTLKNKVIKTNQLLQIYENKVQEVKKRNYLNKNLRNKLENAGKELKQLKLKNETLTFGLKLAEKGYGPLKEEHEKLRQDFEIVEAESSEIVNSLQIKYQNVHKELEKCKSEIVVLRNKLNVQSIIETDVKIKKKAEQRIKVQNEKINHFKDQLKSMQKEEQDVKTDFQLTIASREKEIKRLSTELTLIRTGPIQDFEEKLHLQEQNCSNLKRKFESDLETKEMIIHKQSEEIKQLLAQLQEQDCSNLRRHFDTNPGQIVIHKQPEEIKQLPAELNRNEVIILEVDKTIENTNNHCDTVPSDEHLRQIFQEYVIPPLILSIPELDNEKSDESCLEENVTNCSVAVTECEIQTEEPIPSSAKKSDLMKRALAKRNVRKRKKHQPHDNNSDLFKMLLKLQKDNINFCISNEPLMQSNHYLEYKKKHKKNQFYCDLFGMRRES